MVEVLRIVDRIKIPARGTVYYIKVRKDSNIHIGDIFEDMRHNHFRIKGIEMFRKASDGKNRDYVFVGLLFELTDEVEAYGNILVKGQQKINFLFCNHPLYSQKADEDYEEEYQEAALKHTCALFSYENLLLGKLSLYGKQISGLTIYRGWMMKPEMYRLFYELLEEKNIILINTPEEYERYHLLPGWYKDFENETPQSIWEKEGSLEGAFSMTKSLEGSFIVKDYVKSRKHEWYDACFIRDISDRENTSKIINNFINRQDSDLVGGIVLRRYEKLKRIGFHEISGMPISEEYRVFIFAGRILIVDDYWRQDKKVSLSDNERKWMEEKSTRVKSNFVTMDLARKEDGSLIIMEFGDGQVSGLQQIKPKDFYLRIEVM
ncbi:MAG: ATP-grasp domain-containing protein [Clostridiales bacterium]|nr:ATP-grasp domain-containing protein [Clostridiales bacterium]